MGNKIENDGHDGKCRCGVLVPCEEPDCSGIPGHEDICEECSRAEADRPDPFDLACERRYD